MGGGVAGEVDGDRQRYGGVGIVERGVERGTEVVSGVIEASSGLDLVPTTKFEVQPRGQLGVVGGVAAGGGGGTALACSRSLAYWRSGSRTLNRARPAPSATTIDLSTSDANVMADVVGDSADDTFDGLQLEAAAEHGELLEDDPFGRVEEVVAPVERGANRVMAGVRVPAGQR